MSRFRIKKIVASCFLEAAKMAMDDLGAYRLALEEQRAPGVRDPAALPRLYAACRRLRDYLKASMRQPSEVVELTIDGQERAMLVACCIRYVEALDLEIERLPEGQQRHFEQKKQQVISDWTVELAIPPVIELPLPPLTDRPGRGASKLMGRLRSIDGSVRNPLAPGGNAERARDPEVGTAACEDRSAKARVMPIGMQDETAEPDVLIEPSRLREPRLRSMAAMDLRSLEIAEENADYRVATVMIASVFEAAVLDYALHHREELELEGKPDTWDLQEILSRFLGDSASISDRSFASSLFSAHRILSPVHQITRPTAATAANVQQLKAFVVKMLSELGYRSAGCHPLQMPL